MKKNILITSAVSIALSAVSSAATTVTFDFGSEGSKTTGINNITDVTTSVLNPIIDQGGTLNGVNFSLAYTNPPLPPASAALSVNGAGSTSSTTTDAPNIGPFVTTTYSDSLYGDNAAGRTSMTLSITGLDLGMQYSFEFISTRGPITDDRITVYTATGSNTGTVNLNARNNTSLTASILNIAPTPDALGGLGSISIEMHRAADPTTGNFYYLNGLQMSVSPIPEPTGAVLLGLSGLGLFLRRRRA